MWGEQVHAIVVRRAPAPTLTEDSSGPTPGPAIAGYKVPKSVEFRDRAAPAVGALKPLKRELRKPYWEGQQMFVQ